MTAVNEIPNPENITMGRQQLAARRRRDIKRAIARTGLEFDNERSLDLPYLARLQRRYHRMGVMA